MLRPTFTVQALEMRMAFPGDAQSGKDKAVFCIEKARESRDPSLKKDYLRR